MKLKIGDKIRIRDTFPETGRGGKIYEVSQTAAEWDYNSVFICRVQEIDTPFPWSCLMFEYEIEKIVTKGPQLLFPFMEG